MQKRIANIAKIGCGGCERTIQTNLSALEGVTLVKADRNTKTAVVEFDETKIDWNTIEARLVEINYPPQTVMMPA